jgi:hypothetical protein
MIKILTGYSERGGSTIALSNLTNSLNEAGYETIMYGPHDYHLNLCKSGKLTQEVFDNLTDDDRVITHFLQLPQRPKGKVVVLSCHEKWWFDVGGIRQHWDKIIFLHQAHRDYHNKYKGDYGIIPNIKEPLIKKEKEDLDKIAGIIGSIEDRKQTHISIQRALKDKCDKIYLFGRVGDNNYYNTYVKPLLNPKIVEYGHIDNKQEMYDMVGRVYHSSKGEVACLVKDECWSSGTKFFGGVETENEVFEGSNEDVINMWKKVLKL